ncbi:MAG: S1C family serine protease, partial [Streptosporangiaceae bacterium]
MTESEHARGSRRWSPWVALVAALVVGGCTTGSASSSGASSGNSGTTSGNSAVSACAVTPVANEVVPSVVTIAAHGPSGSGTGSGEVIRSDGYILTNNHVISIAAASGGSVEVQFSDGQTEPATITGRDPQTDLAVLKVQTSRQLNVIALGSSSSVQVGEPVVAVGA